MASLRGWLLARADDGRLTGAQCGQARLWDQLKSSYADWISLARPRREDLGLAVSCSGEHTIWHRTPDGDRWAWTPQARTSYGVVTRGRPGVSR